MKTKVPEIRKRMKGPMNEPIKKPLTWKEIKSLADKECRIKVVFAIELDTLACISHDNTFDGLNDYVDEWVFSGDDYEGVVMDLCFTVIGHTPASQDNPCGEVHIEVNCDASELEDYNQIS